MTISPGTNGGKSQPTVHELTSLIQELQERMNYMNDPEEFQDIESICSRKLFHVPSQLAVVPSPRSLWNLDQSLRLDTWKLRGTLGNVFDGSRAVINSSSTPYQEMLHSWNQSATSKNPVQKSTGRPVAKGEEQIGSTIPMPMIARRPSTMNSFFPAEGQNHMADQQRLQILGLYFDKFPTLSTFSCWKVRFKTQGSSSSSFPSESVLWMKKGRWSIRWTVYSHRAQFKVKLIFQNFEMLDARIASALNNIIQKTYFEKKVSLEEQSPERGSVSTRKTDRLHDLRLLSTHWCS